MTNESYWTDVGFVREKLKLYADSYTISKTLTEKAVLEFAAEHKLDLVTVIPSFVVGPFICPKFPGSVRSMLALVLGTDSPMDNSLLNLSRKTLFLQVFDT